jgi:hypothetical protein
MASLAKFAFGKLSYALSDYIVNPVPLVVMDSQGVTKSVAVILTKPVKINRGEEIGLIIVGNLDEASIKKFEEDLVAGIALGHYKNLQDHQKSKLKSDNFKFISSKYADYQFTHKGAVEYGVLVAAIMKKASYMRKEIKKTSYAKAIKWDEDFNDSQVKAREDKYKGKGAVITYWEKGMMGEKNWIVPLEAVHIWQHVKTYPGDEAERLANELYAAFQAGNENMFKSHGASIEIFINKENKARRKAMKKKK